jgi:hypothetical protein
LGIQNSSPSPKRYSIRSFEVNKKRCTYVIYKQIDANSYYGYMNDEDGILDKVGRPTKEEIVTKIFPCGQVNFPFDY